MASPFREGTIFRKIANRNLRAMLPGVAYPPPVGRTCSRQLSVCHFFNESWRREPKEISASGFSVTGVIRWERFSSGMITSEEETTPTDKFPREPLILFVVCWESGSNLVSTAAGKKDYD